MNQKTKPNQTKVSQMFPVIRSLFLAAPLLLMSVAFAQEQGQSPAQKGAQSKASAKNIDADTSRKFTGDEVFTLPELDWGFNLNLKGFVDLSETGKTETRAAFGVREDSTGITLAHLFINPFNVEDPDSTARNYANLKFRIARNDTNVIVTSVRRRPFEGFELLEYDRKEIWPQPDKNNPGKMFDSTLIRRHFDAIIIQSDRWINLHLSKTEFENIDKSFFTDFLATFKIVDPAPVSQEQK